MTNKVEEEIKKQFWKSQSFQIGFIIILIALSLILPKIPLLRGWEYKYTSATVELGKMDIPNDAVRIKNAEEAVALLPEANAHLVDFLKLRGPIPIAAWTCKPLGLKGLCIRYIWKEDHSLILSVVIPNKKIKKKLTPFIKSGWAGYLFTTTERDLAVAVAGPFEPEDILSTLTLPKW